MTIGSVIGATATSMTFTMCLTTWLLPRSINNGDFVRNGYCSHGVKINEVFSTLATKDKLTLDIRRLDEQLLQQKWRVMSYDFVSRCFMLCVAE